jgi:hypothetical protein
MQKYGARYSAVPMARYSSLHCDQVSPYPASSSYPVSMTAQGVPSPEHREYRHRRRRGEEHAGECACRRALDRSVEHRREGSAVLLYRHVADGTVSLPAGRSLELRWLLDMCRDAG